MGPSSTSLPPHSTRQSDCVAASTERYLRAEIIIDIKKNELVHNHTVTIQRSKRYFLQFTGIGICRSKRFIVNRARASEACTSSLPDPPLLDFSTE